MKKSVAGLTAVVAALVLLAGCKSSTNLDDVSYGAITRNLTPELASLAERPVDIDRNIAVHNNQNMRSFMNDLGRAFYTDRPSWLSPFHELQTSGQPR